MSIHSEEKMLTMIDQRHLEDQYYAADDAVQQDDAVVDDATVEDGDDAVQEDDAVQQEDNVAAEDNNGDNSNAAAVASTNVRATNCLSFTVEPENEQFNALAGPSEIPTPFISEESFLFYSLGDNDNNQDDLYDGMNDNFGQTYMINVQDWVAAFGGTTCESLANYDGSIFGNMEGIENIYWGPICNHGSFGITMGIFLDEDCSVYAPELSEDLQTYLFYDENGNPDEDMLQASYAMTSLNDYYQEELSCNNGYNDGEDNSFTCYEILKYSTNEGTCEPIDSSLSQGNVPFSFSSWYKFGDPHRYYHLSQNDMLDPSTTCNAVNDAIVGRYTFEDMLMTLEEEDGDTAKALENYNNEILTPGEKYMALVGALVLALIGCYCCFATTRRMHRTHKRSKRQQQRSTQPDDNDSIIYELGRTFTIGSSSDESSTGASKKEPLIPSGGESLDITNSSTKYPIADSSYSFQPRLERDGSIVPQDKRMQVIAVVEKEDTSTVAESKSGKSSNRFLRWMKFGGKEDNEESVFDGITINPSQTFDDPFVGIEAQTAVHTATDTERATDTDTLFEGVGTDHEPSI